MHTPRATHASQPVISCDHLRYNYDALFSNVRPNVGPTMEARIQAILEDDHWQDVADQAIYMVVRAWLDRVEPTVASTERYAECRSAWFRRRR